MWNFFRASREFKHLVSILAKITVLLAERDQFSELLRDGNYNVYPGSRKVRSNIGNYISQIQGVQHDYKQ